jgi:hypothetical protein
MWEGDHCPIQANPRPTGILPGMFPAATHNGSLGLIVDPNIHGFLVSL